MSVREAEARAKGGHSVVVTGGSVFEGDVDVRPGNGAEEGGGGDGQDR